MLSFSYSHLVSVYLLCQQHKVYNDIATNEDRFELKRLANTYTLYYVKSIKSMTIIILVKLPREIITGILHRSMVESN